MTRSGKLVASARAKCKEDTHKWTDQRTKMDEKGQDLLPARTQHPSIATKKHPPLSLVGVLLSLDLSGKMAVNSQQNTTYIVIGLAALATAAA
eukprot:scaffold34616_cov80-Skeletonema_marinoi.AAC.1